MQPSIYGPYRYLPITQRKPFVWPGGARLALWVIPNIEFFHLDDPMPGVNNERLSSAQVKTPNVRNWAIRDYGNRVGVWRFFDVLSRYRIRATAALNSDICDYHPQIVERAVDLQWDFMGHCQTNAKRLNEVPAEQEKAAIHQTLERIAKATGSKPAGWLGAGLAETWNTLDYLIDEGVRYVADWTCDDLPFRMNVGGRTLMSIPYSLQVNDTTQFYNQKATHEDFEKIIKAQFDCLYGEAGEVPRVMAIAIHPFVSGVPHWIGAIDRSLEYICSHEGVWLATGSEIIDHFAKSVPDE
ncbi:MAG TPA: polysaccharide deacetylase family protein [Casimicrobiaceae bacterium]|nr:polysaccharide deacetylase family protein [Casimicrobiaceae bacterium]